jgi:hypothetical protein
MENPEITFRKKGSVHDNKCGVFLKEENDEYVIKLDGWYSLQGDDLKKITITGSFDEGCKK